VPEGDTIHRTAARLAPALEGATLVRFEATRASGSMPRAGTTITSVEAQGKYLLVRFADGHVLQTHLRMTGRWDLYRTGERWRKPAHLVRALIEVDGHVAVCFSAPVVRVIRVKPDDRVLDDARRPADASPTDAEAIDAASGTAMGTEADAAEGSAEGTSRGGVVGSEWNWIDATGGGRARGAAADDEAPLVPSRDGLRAQRDQRFATLDHLGPDLCRPDADLDLAVGRMDAFASPDVEIADVLLDQRIAAGIGNVYKSEVLWACRLHPQTPLGRVDAELRRRLLETAATLLQANLTTSRRTTVAGPPGSLAVYGRSRRPCRRCATAIRSQRTGRDNRSTYWCPSCQPPPT
jgi:formamidopyrimidine-DNA glycosylase